MGLLEQMLARPAAKAVIGAGAWTMENYPAVSDHAEYRKRDNRAQRNFIREALGLYHTNRHILRAERLVASRVAGLEWHLEDEDGEEVGDESAERLQAVRDLFEKPTGGERVGNQPMTWRELTGITVRHVGLVNLTHWYLDEIDRLTRWPKRILYIRPDRMTPVVDKSNLTGWILDYREREGTGTPLELDQVLTFYLEVPDEGFYGDGLVEAAVALGRKLVRSDRHELDVLSAGGRLPGILSPREAGVSDEVFKRLTNDMRNIVEMPDAAKRTLIARAPIDFTPTSANPTELSLPELARLGREELYGLWGIHPTVAGFTGAAGLNSGERGNYEEAWTWQNGVQPRVDALYETLQYQLLDRLDLIGINLQLVLHTPTFDDDMPKYDMAQKALNVPLRNVERRAILGLDPFGDDALDNAVWMPVNVVPAAEAPAGAVKARLVVARPPTTNLQSKLTAFLREQRSDVAERLRRHADHISRKNDLSVLWDAKKWDAALEKLLKPYWKLLADDAAERVSTSLRPGKAGLADIAGDAVYARLLRQVGKRVKDINETTRKELSDTIRSGMNEGLGMAELGDRLEAAFTFSDNRAETIARTETGTVWNSAQVESFREFNVEQVTVIDGDEDEKCASANGQTWTLDEALGSPLAHPNCVRDFSPVIGGS